jgi:hypothetical protein
MALKKREREKQLTRITIVGGQSMFTQCKETECVLSPGTFKRENIGRIVSLVNRQT